jgi:hypothetical protein
MNKIRYYALLGAILVILSACESGGKFNMVNRTSYPVYTAVDGSDLVTIPEGESHVFKIDTETQSFLTGEVKQKIPVYLVGETFSLRDEDGVYLDSTEVTIKAGKTTNAFLDPNRASIKIVNNSLVTITRAEIRMVKPTTIQIVSTLLDIPSGESLWQRVKYASLNDSFSYRVDIWLEGATSPLVYGDAETILTNDQQWLITIDEPQDE